jgi:hypothetical protein
MQWLINTARWEAIILVAAFAALTLWKVLGTAGFSGLLLAGDGTLSPGRVQMLVLTIITAMQYLLTTVQDPSHLPVLPPALVAALGGSQAVYLGAKAWTTFGPKGK